eukprot:5252801-Amphidinium_carterae.1
MHGPLNMDSVFVPHARKDPVVSKKGRCCASTIQCYYSNRNLTTYEQIWTNYCWDCGLARSRMLLCLVPRQ